MIKLLLLFFLLFFPLLLVYAFGSFFSISRVLYNKTVKGASQKQAKQRQQEQSKREWQEQIRRRQQEQLKREWQEQIKRDQQNKSNNRTNEEILGLSCGWTKKELKNAYRRKCNQLHPDKWVNMPEKQLMMESEFKNVQQAYKNLSKRL